MRLPLVVALSFYASIMPLISAWAADEHPQQEQKKAAESQLENEDLHKHKFIVPFTEEQAAKKTAPILLLYKDFINPAVKLHPQVYLALWQDGTIVWIKAKNKKVGMSDIRRDTPVEYFQSTLSDEEIKQFFSAVESLGIYELSRTFVVPIDIPGFCIKFNSNASPFSLNFIGIDWPNPPFTYPSSKQMWDEEMYETAEKWQIVYKLIRELIPQDGKKVRLLMKETPKKIEWEVTLADLDSDQSGFDNSFPEKAPSSKNIVKKSSSDLKNRTSPSVSRKARKWMTPTPKNRFVRNRHR